jgi:hypothetical protein
MITLTFGILKPENGDKGSSFFPALEDNFEQLNDHNHDGVTSSKISSLGVLPLNAFVDLVPADFAEQSVDLWRATVTVPAGVLNVDSFNLYFVTGNDRVHPTFERINNTSFYVYMNAAYTVRVYFK